MKTKISVLILCFYIFQANAQLKVLPTGNVGIGTNNPGSCTKLEVVGDCEGMHVTSNINDYGRALWVTINHKLSCSYHLFNNVFNRDVFFVQGDGYAWAWQGYWTGSDIRFKRDISPIISPLETVQKLNGVKYRYVTGPKISGTGNYEDKAGDIASKKFRFGLIAQEVEKILPEIVTTMQDSTLSVNYNDLIAVLIEAIKEQQSQITTLKSEIDEIKGNVDNQKNSNGAKLFQNSPNPFSEKTIITYFIPENTKSAIIYINDMQGLEIKSYQLQNIGSGTITIQASELKAGMYLYSLVLNGQIIDTKRMMLTEK